MSNGGNEAPPPPSEDRPAGLAKLLQAIAPILLAGLLLRVVIAYVIAPGQGLQADLDYFKNAALTLADYGPGGFVAHNGFYQPSPVGYLYFLWPLGLAGRFLGGLLGQPADGITLALLKVPAILADLGIAILLYRAGRRWFGSRAGLVAAALYLFVPITWYESAVFGQVDSVGLFFVVAALLLLLGGWSEPAVAMAVLAAVIKPQNAICLVVIGPILLRRHLFVVGSGPIPGSRSRNAVLDRILVGWFSKRQGFERLVSSAIVAVAVFVIAILPFDLQLLAPPELVSIPVIGQVSGFVSLIGSLADYYHVLTANAFNAWALVGPIPLYSELSRTFIWTFDSLQVIGPIQAVTIGATSFALVTAGVAIVLLLRDDRGAILGSLTVLALAFFALPTRAHERYLFPVFVTFALLVAGTTLSERRWRWWYIALGVLAAVNLHAVVTLSQPGFASPGLIGAPLGDLFRSDAVVIAVSLANTALFGALLVAWARGIALPALASVLLRSAGRRPPSAMPQPSAAPTSSAAARVDAPERLVEERAQRSRTSSPGALDAAMQWMSGLADNLSKPFRRRLDAGSPPADNSGALSTEEAGRLDRRDIWVLIAILVVTFAVRTYRIDTPRGVYFDELYYPATGTEFLQDWRYGIHTEIFEWTHPHISKYVQALSIAAFGNDRATTAASVGTPVRAVAFDPAFFAPETATRYGGDLIAIATGSELRIAPRGLFARAVVAALPGAQLVAFDRATHRLYAADDDGGVWAIDGSAIDAALNGGGAPDPVPIADLQGQITTLRVVVRDRVLAVTDGHRLTLLTGAGAPLATASLTGLSGITTMPVGEQTQLVAAVPGGLKGLDANSLQEFSSIGLPARPLGIEFVDGSDFGWRNQATLPTPTIYATLDSSQMAAVQVGGDGGMTLFDLFGMPGPVVEAHWNRPSNMVHVLGQTSTGDPTIYVVEPHTNSVFADARLPFDPVAWMLDVQPDTPSLDRQQALTFSASGTVVYVDAGSHASAWRLPGVVAGTLTAALMYLLARMLFRRRVVAVLLAVVMALDGLLFIQGRIAMNDSLLGFFIVAAFALLLALMQARPRGPGRWLLPVFGLPVVGLLLGLALGTKWVGVYAIGGAVLMVLARTQAGRWLALAGMVLLTAVFGFQALASQPPNVTFVLLMLGLTVLMGVVVVRPLDPSRGSNSASIPGWVNPRVRFGIPFAFALACLLIMPLVVYVVSYIPWTLSATGDPQLFPGWPPGHTGQTFLDLQSQMYHYHNDLRTPHAASSPWWAWPLGLKPVWGHLNTYSDGSQVIMLLTGNPVLLWLGIPASVFGAWQAWRRRSTALAFVVIAMCSLWLPWARIDRVAYNYHWYTILPFYYLLLAYFLAEVWNGPSGRTWSLARVAVAAVLILPALMWIFKDGLCAVAGVAEINPTSFECNRPLLDVALPLGLWLIGSVVAAWFILGMQKPRRLVAVVVGAAAIGFAVLYPALSALPLPNGWPFIYQGLLPTWDISFQFNSNTIAVSDVPLLGFGAGAVGVAAAALTWIVMRRMPLRMGWRTGSRSNVD
ncbi:MAG: phospholipid carrier-dependent glycosyltransferase [Chloroflexota bacterium]